MLSEKFWQDPVWFAGLLLVLLFLLLIVVLPMLAEWRRRRRRFAVFDRISHAALHDVVIPDSVDGSICVDHLLLFPDAITVFNEKPYAGVIFGDNHIDQWTQSVDKRSYRFANPIHELQAQVMAVNGLLDGGHASGYLVFSDQSEFPWGRPQKVLLRKELRQRFAGNKNRPVEPHWQAAWQALQRNGVVAPSRPSQRLAILLALILLAGSIAWPLVGWLQAAPALSDILSSLSR